MKNFIVTTLIIAIVILILRHFRKKEDQTFLPTAKPLEKAPERTMRPPWLNNNVLSIGSSGSVDFSEIPLLLTAATNTAGTKILLTFDHTMSKPDNFLSDFTMKVGGVSSAITSVNTQVVDGVANHLIYEVVPTVPIAHSAAILVSIAAGNVTSSWGGLLVQVTDKVVTNNVPA